MVTSFKIEIVSLFLAQKKKKFLTHFLYFIFVVVAAVVEYLMSFYFHDIFTPKK